MKMRLSRRAMHECANIKDKTITHVGQKWLLKVIILSLMFAHSYMARRINFIFTHNLVNSNDNISAKLFCSEPSCWKVMALWFGWCRIFVVIMWPLIWRKWNFTSLQTMDHDQPSVDTNQTKMVPKYCGRVTLPIRTIKSVIIFP